MSGKTHKLDMLLDAFEDEAAKLGKLLAHSGYAMSEGHKLTIGFDDDQQAMDAHSGLAKMSIAYKKLFDLKAKS